MLLFPPRSAAVLHSSEVIRWPGARSCFRIKRRFFFFALRLVVRASSPAPLSRERNHRTQKYAVTKGHSHISKVCSVCVFMWEQQKGLLKQMTFGQLQLGCTFFTHTHTQMNTFPTWGKVLQFETFPTQTELSRCGKRYMNVKSVVSSVCPIFGF